VFNTTWKWSTVIAVSCWGVQAFLRGAGELEVEMDRGPGLESRICLLGAVHAVN
jgi:hypothetical protein